MKIAALYSGRSQSQPVLLNQLDKRLNIDLHLFRDNPKEDVPLSFDYKKYVLNVEGIEIRGKQTLWINQYILRKKWRSYLRKHLDSSFDLVITMNDLGPPSIMVAESYDIPSLFFIRNLESSGQEMYNPKTNILQNIQEADFGATIQYPYFVKNFKKYKNGLQRATQPIANSEYVASRLTEDFGVSSKIIYPPIKLNNYKVEYSSEGSIGMVGAKNKDKGADIFFDIVEAMPSESFVSAGNIRDQGLKERAESLDNLTHMGYVKDMRDFYQQTKLIVVPSRWNEAFGRAAAEPMVSGIPCVVSNRGGLPEVVGDTGEIVSEISSTKAWINAIRRGLTNHDSDAQKQRAKRFSADKQGERLVKIAKSVVS